MKEKAEKKAQQEAAKAQKSTRKGVTFDTSKLSTAQSLGLTT